jgi:hypothetical protein
MWLLEYYPLNIFVIKQWDTGADTSGAKGSTDLCNFFYKYFYKKN